VKALDIDRLRGRLLWALDATRPTEEPPASLFVLVLGACWLAAPDAEAEERLEELFYSACSEELLDGDDVINALLMAVPS
jgi:hypothetical protein